MKEPDVGPSRWYYALGAVIVVVGIAYSTTYLISGLSGMVSELQQIPAPGDSDLLLHQAGEYQVFYESKTTFQERVYTTGESMPGLEIEIINKTSGSRVASYLPSGSSSYSIGGRSGESLVAFRIDQPGIYEIRSSYPEGATGPKVVLAVGHDFIGSMLSIMLYTSVLFFGSAFLGFGIVIITYMKRRKALRDRKDERLIRGG